MAALITPPGPKRRFWSLLTSLTLSKEFTLKLPLRRAFAGERAGPVAKQREGEVVGVAEAVCGWIDSDPPYPSAEVTPHDLSPHEDVGGEGPEDEHSCVNPIERTGQEKNVT
jgi:hypothetical protein